jgi:ubiquinone/menaquinone biosynthesis C-methylase UbiE
MSEQNRRAWDWQAQRYQATHLHSRDTVYYWSEAYPNEDDLHFLGEVRGINILDLGSGAGQSGIALAKRGATVTCYDLSQAQLDIGRKYAQEDGVVIEFIRGDMQDLSTLPRAHFDAVVSCAAISYVEDAAKVFREVAKVLKPRGQFVVSCEHAAWMALGARYLWPEAHEDPSYFYRGPVKFRWEDADPADYEFLCFRRPLQDYLNWLIAANFIIEYVEELPFLEDRLPQDTFFQEVLRTCPQQLEFARLYPQAVVICTRLKQ